MDWVSVLFLLLFFVLPLIQQVLEHARKGREVPPEWEYTEDDGSTSPPPRRRVEEPATAPTSGGGWSEGWGQWPGSTDLEEEDPEPLQRPEPEWARKSEVEAAEPIAAGPHRASPVPAPAAPAQLTVPQAIVPARRVIAAPMKPIASPRRRDRVDVRQALQHPAEVRKALILREVLNPPLSLRDLDPKLP